MNAPKEGWPVGMLCVVDYHPYSAGIGCVVEVLGNPEPARSDCFGVEVGWFPAGQPLQLVKVLAGGGPARTGRSHIPVAWLRPLTDPDAETQGSDADVEAMAS